jgi:hypothetical protein
LTKETDSDQAAFRTARGLRDRWCNAGWTHSAKLAVSLPPFVWLTRQGSRLVGSPYRTWDPNPGLITHIEATTNLRLLLERELKLGEWQCERSLAQTWPSRSDSRPHLPDAVLANDKRIAIEVELTLKSRARLATIVEQLSWDYHSVWYFAPERFRGALFEFATSAPYGVAPDRGAQKHRRRRPPSGPLAVDAAQHLRPRLRRARRRRARVRGRDDPRGACDPGATSAPERWLPSKQNSALAELS